MPLWYREVVLSYLENVKIEAIVSINEVQRTGCDRDSELVIKNFTVKLSFEHLWFPGLPQTSGQLQEIIV